MESTVLEDQGFIKVEHFWIEVCFDMLGLSKTVFLSVFYQIRQVNVTLLMNVT